MLILMLQLDEAYLLSSKTAIRSIFSVFVDQFMDYGADYVSQVCYDQIWFIQVEDQPQILLCDFRQQIAGKRASKKRHFIFNIFGYNSGMRPNRICKFGDKCNKFANGTCTFDHPTGQQFGGMGGQGQMEQQGPRQPRPCRFGINCKDLANGNCNFYHPPSQGGGGMGTFGGMGGGMETGPKGWTGGMGGQGGFTGPKDNYSNPNDDGIGAYCRDFHLDQQCKFGEKCKKKHFFIANSEESLKRLKFIRNIPNSPHSKLTKFNTGEKQIFVLRMEKDVNFFDFNIETKVLGDIFQWRLPENGKPHFYDHKNEYIYYSMENPHTSYEDIGIYNLQEQKNYYVSNSHQGRVTGMAHFNPNVLLTCSIEGELKVWCKQNDQYTIHVDSTKQLMQKYNPSNAKFELEFIDISELNGTKIITLGTSDCRLLFFIGEGLDYKAVTLSEPYSKVYRIRYVTDKGIPYAVILTWNHNSTISALISVNLTDFSLKNLIEAKNTQDQPWQTISIFQFLDDYLMVGTVGGQLSIYRFPDTTQRIGAIIHQNPIVDIVTAVGEIKSTNLKLKLMLILEKRTEKREGSLGVYLMK